MADESWLTLPASASSHSLHRFVGIAKRARVHAIKWQSGLRRAQSSRRLPHVRPIPKTEMVRFGPPWLRSASYGIVAFPIVLLVAWRTDSWAIGLSKHRLRQATRLFLLLIALKLIWEWIAS